MATLPIHTVQHIKSVYNKYQVVAAVFTALTLLAALFAAVSGFQLAKLRKMQPVEVASSPVKGEEAAPPPMDSGLEKKVEMLESQLQSEKSTSQTLRAKVDELEEKIATMKVAMQPRTGPAAMDSGLEKQIKMLESQLQSEKTTSQALRGKVRGLEDQIAAMKVAMQPRSQPAPKKPETPVKPKTPEVAPSTETPGEYNSVAAPPATAAPSVPSATSKPAVKSNPTEKSGSQLQTDMPAPRSGSTMTEETPLESKPSDAQTSTQPAGTATDNDQSVGEPAVVPAPATSPDGMRQAEPQETGDGTGTPPDSSAQPPINPNGSSQTNAEP